MSELICRKIPKKQVGGIVQKVLGYTPVVAGAKKLMSNLAENVNPYEYSEPLTRVVDNAILNNKDSKRKELEAAPEGGDKERVDLLQMLANKKQKYNTILPSAYKPSISENKNTQYYRSPSTEAQLQNYVDEHWTRKNITSEADLPQLRSKALGTMKLGYGKDKEGSYMSYYDKWDLNPVPKTRFNWLNKTVDAIATGIPNALGVTRTPEVYGRVYLPKQTLGGPINRPRFEDWYKTIVPARDGSLRNDTTTYKLRRAYDIAPQTDLDEFATNPDAHLMSAYENRDTGIYEFMKSKHHDTIQKELDWYNSPLGENFKNRYNLDTTGEYYRYVPKRQAGGKFLQPTDPSLPATTRIPYRDMKSSEVAISIGGENGEPAYLIPSYKHGEFLKNPLQEYKKTKEHLGGPFKTWQEADQWEQQIRHPYVEKGQPIPTPLKTRGDFQNGGTIDPQQFTADYINSPNYKKRLSSSGYQNPDKEIKERLGNVLSTKVVTQEANPSAIKQVENEVNNVPYSSTGSMYNPERGTIIFDEADAKKLNSTRGEVVSHEFAHSELNPTRTSSAQQNSRLNTFDRTKLKQLLIPNKSRDLHNALPDENKADLNALRFELKSKGLYDTGTQDFNEKILNKLPKSFTKDRLLKNYTPKDLTWLMNNIAAIKQTGTSKSS